MAIEPLSSAMTYQAQAAVKPQTQPVQPADTDVAPDNQAVNVDNTTAAVKKVQAESKEGGENGETGKNGNGLGSDRQQSKTSQSANEYLKKAIAELNSKISNSNEEAIFGIHEETNRIMIKIVDKDTKETIKEFPPEKTLDMIAKVWEMAGIMAGILIDEKR